MSQTRNRAALSMPLSYANLAYFHCAEHGSSTDTSCYCEHNIHTERFEYTFGRMRHLKQAKLRMRDLLKIREFLGRQQRKQQLRYASENTLIVRTNTIRFARG